MSPLAPVIVPIVAAPSSSAGGVGSRARAVTALLARRPAAASEFVLRVFSRCALARAPFPPSTGVPYLRHVICGVRQLRTYAAVAADGNNVCDDNNGDNINDDSALFTYLRKAGHPAAVRDAWLDGVSKRGRRHAA